MGEGVSAGVSGAGEVDSSMVTSDVHLPLGFPARVTGNDAVTMAAPKGVRICTACHLAAADWQLWQSNSEVHVVGRDRLNHGSQGGTSQTRWFAELGTILIDSASLALAR